MALKPALQPLPATRLAFPSELREQNGARYLEATKHCEEEGSEECKSTITPPPAYTEFLNTFSPIFASPSTSRANFAKYMKNKSPRGSPNTTAPSSTTCGNTSKHISPSGIPSPRSAKNPGGLRRLRIPPPYAYSPTSATTYTPRTPHSVRSPYSPAECQLRQYNSPVSEHGGPVVVRHVVTTTITVRRAPQLEAPPRGKRRRNTERR